MGTKPAVCNHWQSPKSPIPDLSSMHSNDVSCPYEHLLIGDFGVCRQRVCVFDRDMQLRSVQYLQCITTCSHGYFRNLHHAFRSCMFVQKIVVRHDGLGFSGMLLSFVTTLQDDSKDNSPDFEYSLM